MNTKLIDTLWDIQYPKPMDVYHPKDQHMCTHIEAMGHWNALTLSLWEVTWSSRVNIFTRNIGYIGPIMQNSTMSTFLHIGLPYTYWIQTKSPRQEHFDAHFGSNERWQLRRIALDK